MSTNVYWNNTPFKIRVNGITILPGYCEKLDSADATVIRMLESGLLSTERIQKVEQFDRDRAINSHDKPATEEDVDGVSTAAEPSEIRFAGEAIYEGLPRVEPFNRRGGNKRPSDSMGGY